MADPQRIDAGREALLRSLQEAGVEFVLIGGAAIQSHGVAYRTEDVDITPRRTPANLERLAAALNALDCTLVIDPSDRSQDVPLPAGYFTVANLSRRSVWKLRTAHGKLDIPFEPAGFPRGYEDLSNGARPRLVADTSIAVPIASLADVEQSKRTAGRPKDVDYLSDAGRLQAPPSGPPPATAPDDMTAIRDASLPLAPRAATTPSKGPGTSANTGRHRYEHGPDRGPDRPDARHRPPSR